MTRNAGCSKVANVQPRTPQGKRKDLGINLKLITFIKERRQSMISNVPQLMRSSAQLVMKSNAIMNTRQPMRQLTLNSAKKSLLR